jgi:hypothetical protein
MRRPWMRTLREHLNTARRFTKRGGLQRIAGGLVIVTFMSACDTWGPHDAVTSPSNDPALTASISVPVISTNGETRPAVHFIPFRCTNGMQFTGPLDIAMTAGHNVDLHKVTIRLVNTPLVGQLSGAVQATNFFDSDELASAFGSTQIPGGTVRTLRFRTDLSCGRTDPDFVAADIQFMEVSGRRNSITVTAPFGSAIDLVTLPALVKAAK